MTWWLVTTQAVSPCDRTTKPLPVARPTLAVVFLMAGITKVTDLHGFADEVLVHSGLPYSVGRVVAVALPWLELTCGMCLAR